MQQSIVKKKVLDQAKAAEYVMLFDGRVITGIGR